MSMYPLVKVQQPEPFDIVDQSVLVAGVGTGFEATLNVRVRDGNSAQLALTFVNAGGGLGELGNFQIAVDLPGPPPTPNGFVEVFDGTATEVPANLVVVPVVFGANLVDGYFGFSLREVRPGDTLFGIAEEVYGNGNLFPIIFEANRNQIANPNLIFPGQTLRIPKGSAGL
ncbi:MAG: LysM peptidoglycan-binding domain-containing protein [Actinomycetota bacterium]